MGSSCNKMTPEERKEYNTNKVIDRRNMLDHQLDRQFLKLLLLGTGESGKSTIFKQVRQLYGRKWTPGDFDGYRKQVYMNINNNILAMLAARKDLRIELSNPRLADPFTGPDYHHQTDITPQVTQAILRLWDDPGMKALWERRSEYQVIDCIEYYVHHLRRIGVGLANYRPTFDDVIQCRVQTAGVTNVQFQLYGANFKMYDVGGQRSERKKWISCFDNVVTVIFVAAINEYDQKLYEDGVTNRTVEAVKVWEDIVNRETFQNVGFVLFLNKWDIFQRKVLEFPYRDDAKGINMDYTGKDPMKEPEETRKAAIFECAEHAKSRFFDVIEVRTGYGSVSTHFTNATSTETMDTVFGNCRDQILRKHLYINGFPVA